jgi:hypothetical protein
VIIGVNV